MVEAVERAIRSLAARHAKIRIEDGSNDFGGGAGGAGSFDGSVGCAKAASHGVLNVFGGIWSAALLQVAIGALENSSKLGLTPLGFHLAHMPVDARIGFSLQVCSLAG